MALAQRMELNLVRGSLKLNRGPQSFSTITSRPFFRCTSHDPFRSCGMSSTDARDCIDVPALVEAVSSGSVQVVEQLLLAHQSSDAVNTVEVPDPNRKNSTLLHMAARVGNVAMCDLLLRLGANIHARDSWGDTPLCRAVYAGHSDVVVALAKAGADPDPSRSPDDVTPLYFAAQEDKPDTIKVLLSLGARVDGNPNVGKDTPTPLMCACSLDKPNAARALIAAGADCCASTEDSSCLFGASELGNVEVAKLLVDHGVNPLWQNDKGHTALYRAAGGGCVAMVHFLLEVGIPVDLGPSPLLAAAQYDHLECMRVLLEHGADTEVVLSFSRSTPLWLACGRNHVEGVELLLSHGADGSGTREHGVTLATRASLDCLPVLQRHGVPMDAVDERGRTALYHAVRSRSVLRVRKLLEAGADPNAGDGRFPLYKAARLGALDCIPVLLQAGASPLACDPVRRRCTLFEVLSQHCQADVESTVRALLEAGADVEQVDATGIKVWEAALRWCCPVPVLSLVIAACPATLAVSEHTSSCLAMCTTLRPPVLHEVLSRLPDTVFNLSEDPWIAAASGCHALFPHFVRLGFDLDAGQSPRTTTTCLHVAIQRRHGALVATLLRMGARVVHKDVDAVFRMRKGGVDERLYEVLFALLACDRSRALIISDPHSRRHLVFRMIDQPLSVVVRLMQHLDGSQTDSLHREAEPFPAVKRPMAQVQRLHCLQRSRGNCKGHTWWINAPLTLRRTALCLSLVLQRWGMGERASVAVALVLHTLVMDTEYVVVLLQEEMSREGGELASKEGKGDDADDDDDDSLFDLFE